MILISATYFFWLEIKKGAIKLFDSAFILLPDKDSNQESPKSDLSVLPITPSSIAMLQMYIILFLFLRNIEEKLSFNYPCATQSYK